MTIAALKHFPSGTPSWGLVGDQNVKQPLAQGLFLKMSSIRRNSKWCEFIVRSHGCYWKETCWHAHTQAEYDEAHADDPPDPPDVEHTPLEQTLYAHSAEAHTLPTIQNAYYAMPRRPTMQLQRRPPSPRMVGSFDIRLKNRGWVADAPWAHVGDCATGDAAGADDAAGAAFDHDHEKGGSGVAGS